MFQNVQTGSKAQAAYFPGDEVADVWRCPLISMSKNVVKIPTYTKVKKKWSSASYRSSSWRDSILIVEINWYREQNIRIR